MLVFYFVYIVCIYFSFILVLQVKLSVFYLISVNIFISSNKYF